MDVTMPDVVRERLKVPSLSDVLNAKATAEADASTARAKAVAGLHFHLWAETGWSGSLSPRLARLDDVSEALRNIASEGWCDGLVADTEHFPGTLFFAKHKGTDEQSLRLAVRQCGGEARHGIPCNKSGQWR